MANKTPSERAWDLLQQIESAYIAGHYDKVTALSAMAQSYCAIPSADTDAGISAWFSQDAGGTTLAVDFAAQSVTGATPPADAECSWSFGDDSSTTVTNKALTSNVATITTAAAHNLSVGNKVTVAISDAVFDGTFTVTAVSETTFSYAKTNANIPSAAATGTITVVGLTVSHAFASNGKKFVVLTVNTAALEAVTYSRWVDVPYSA